MLTRARSFLASNRDASELVQRAKKFSIRLPVVGKVSVPPPDQLAFYGVLGGLTVAGLVDWPVALVIGAGQAVAARHFSDRPAAEPEHSRQVRETKVVASTAKPAHKAAPRKVASKGAPRKAAVKSATA